MGYLHEPQNMSNWGKLQELGVISSCMIESWGKQWGTGRSENLKIANECSLESLRFNLRMAAETGRSMDTLMAEEYKVSGGAQGMSKTNQPNFHPRTSTAQRRNFWENNTNWVGQGQ